MTVNYPITGTMIVFSFIPKAIHLPIVYSMAVTNILLYVVVVVDYMYILTITQQHL